MLFGLELDGAEFWESQNNTYEGNIDEKRLSKAVEKFATSW
jgi:hypothetical protein